MQRPKPVDYPIDISEFTIQDSNNAPFTPINLSIDHFKLSKPIHLKDLMKIITGTLESMNGIELFGYPIKYERSCNTMSVEYIHSIYIGDTHHVIHVFRNLEYRDKNDMYLIEYSNYTRGSMMDVYGIGEILFKEIKADLSDYI